MTLSDPSIVLALLIGLGVGAQWVASRVGVPAIVLLLGLGLTLGPGLGLLEPRELLGDLFEPLVSVSVGFVLFEGGLSLRWREARELGRPLVGLVTVGPLVTFALGCGLARLLIGLSWPTAAVLAAILVVTGPTVIKPLLRTARLRSRPAQLLRWESIVNDPLGALLAVVALEAAVGLSRGTADELWVRVPLLLFTSAAIGGAAGWALGRAMDAGAIAEHLKVPSIFAGVLAVFTGANALMHEAGLLSVTVMGVVLANLSSPNVEGVRRFKEDVATILVAVLFLVLAADLEWSVLASLTLGGGAFVVALLLIVRPAASWCALAFSGVSRQEKTLIGWIAPRGVVAAAMGAALQERLVAGGFEDGRLLVPILFAVILVTVVLHGLTLRPLARRLGLSSEGEGGLLIVGADRWVLDLARAVEAAGVDVLLVDSDSLNVSRARKRGFETYLGEATDEETLDELPVERLDVALAATHDDNYNALSCLALSGIFGRERVLQLTPEDDGSEPHLRGRSPWGAAGSYDRLAARRWSGGAFANVSLTEESGWEDFRSRAPDALALFAVRDGRVVSMEDNGAPTGSTVVYLE